MRRITIQSNSSKKIRGSIPRQNLGRDVITAIATLLLIGNLAGCVETVDEVTDTVAPEETLIASEEPTTEETATEEPFDPDSADNKTYFVISGTGQVIDMNKDLDDAVTRAENSQLIRLSGNILELSFNLGQLQSLDAPSVVASDWQEAMGKLESSIDSISDVLSDFIADEASLSEMLEAIESVRARVNALTSILERVE